LACGFFAFSIWLTVMSLLEGELVISQPLYLTHIGVTLLLGWFALKLCGHCDLSLAKLRFIEASIFAAPAVYFLLLDYERLMKTAHLDQHSHVQPILSGWMLLIFSYALFIPNSWRRAAIVIGIFAAA